MIVKRSVTLYLTDVEAKELREQIRKVFEDNNEGIEMYPAINELLDLIDEALEL